MKKDNAIFLNHILDSIDAIEKYLKKTSKTEFFKSEQLQDAVVRRLEVIGEAVRNIDDKIKRDNKEIEWKKISGMRDILIHHYFGIDKKLVWATVRKDLPILKKQIKKLVEYFK